VVNEARPRILIVEDDRDTGELLKLALSGNGYAAELAGGADEALSLLRAGPFDLLVTDYDMPRKTGAQLLREARAAGLLEQTAALVITAHPEPRGLDPATPLLRKPLDIERLLVQVRVILHGRPSPRPPEPHPAPAPEARAHLLLYLSRASHFSAGAQRRLQEILSHFDMQGVEFEVCDLVADALSAERDRVVFTPTLVFRGPGARAWVLGDFTEPRVVEDLLAVAGLRRKA
jgi:DNA-binding response OmpR family regulator